MREIPLCANVPYLPCSPRGVAKRDASPSSSSGASDSDSKRSDRVLGVLLFQHDSIKCYCAACLFACPDITWYKCELLAQPKSCMHMQMAHQPLATSKDAAK